MNKNNEQIIKLDGSFITIEQAKKAGLLRNKEIIIDEINAKEYTKTAFELAKETLAEKDRLSEYYDKLLQRKEQECEELKEKLKKIAEFRHNYCMNCEDLLKPNHSCKGCNMVTLKGIIEVEDDKVQL